MTTPAQRPKPPGKPKGTKNRVSADVKALAKLYCAEAVDLLGELMLDSRIAPAARIQAAKELLDRGYGKPAQAVHVGGTDGGILRVVQMRPEDIKRVMENDDC